MLLNLYLVLLHVTFCISSTRGTATYPFQNYNLTWEERTNDLVARLTLDELVQQLAKGGAGDLGGPAPAIARLGILPYQWNTECLRGAASSGSATSFPQAIGLAATFDTEVVELVAHMTGIEVRAKHNTFMKYKQYFDHTGLSCFAPVINIMRHPFWGRNQETYGEDPYLSGLLAFAFVTGLQGNHPRYVLASAGCKHFAAYDGPENYPSPRFSFNAAVSDADLYQTFLPQFRQCILAGSFSVMCSYNSVNGIPACANYRLLTKILRQEWGFQGYVVSDEGALEFSISFHKYFKNELEAAIGAFRSGVNLELSPMLSAEKYIVFESLKQAFDNGSVTLDELRSAAYPLFYTRMRLGEFDPVSMNPYASLNQDNWIQKDISRSVSLNAAMASFVLLKNTGNYLPIDFFALKQRVAVVGPFARNMSLMYGDYSADRMPEYEVDIFQGLSQRFIQVTHGNYCMDGVFCQRTNISDLLRVIDMSDVLVIAVGTSTYIETEGNDRKDTMLPNGQRDLISKSIEGMKSMKKSIPIILLVFSSGTVNTGDSFATNPNITAMLWCGFPGQTVGTAVANVLSGQFIPYAALPFTWYDKLNKIASLTDYKMSNNQTYRYRDYTDTTQQWRPMFHFGYGLSYCNIQFLKISAPSQIVHFDLMTLNITVVNTGPLSCPYIVKVYLSKVDSRGPDHPLLWLSAVSKIKKLRIGAKHSVRVNVMPNNMRLWNPSTSSLEVLPGTYKVIVGNYFDSQCKSCKISVNVRII